MKNTVLLTGFAGFIGSQLLRDLLENDFNVIGVDNLSEGSNYNNYKDLIGKFEIIIADISDTNLFQLLKNYNIDYVINNCAQTHVSRCWNQYDTFIKSNVQGPTNLANIFLKRNLKKFVQVSTDEIFYQKNQPFTENSEIRPSNLYASTKASAEMILMNYCEGFNLPLVITNGGNCFGYRQSEKIVPLSIEKIVKGEKIPLYKTPARRQYLHVSDHSAGIIKAMLKGKIGERYCLASEPENELYTHDLIQLICDNMNVKFEDVVQYVEDRPNYDLRYWMSNEKAKKELEWYPKINIKEEIKNIINWYIKNS